MTVCIEYYCINWLSAAFLLISLLCCDMLQNALAETLLVEISCGKVTYCRYLWKQDLPKLKIVAWDHLVEEVHQGKGVATLWLSLRIQLAVRVKYK